MKTSFYGNWRKIDGQKIAISGDGGRGANFIGATYTKLAPKWEFFKVWKENKEKIAEKLKFGLIDEAESKKLLLENEDFYIKNFYLKVLKPLDPRAVWSQLGENAVLLCYEKPTEFCHRFLVSAWLELSLGVQVDELGCENNHAVQANRTRLKEKIQNQMSFDKIKSGNLQE